VSGIYRISQNTVCVVLCANKIVDGKVQKVVVMRNTWDRACWLDAQLMLARISAQVAGLPNAPAATTRCACIDWQKEVPEITQRLFLPPTGRKGSGNRAVDTWRPRRAGSSLDIGRPLQPD
jgi:hypothetical protein